MHQKLRYPVMLARNYLHRDNSGFLNGFLRLGDFCQWKCLEGGIKIRTQPSFVSGFRLVMADYWSGLIPRYSSLGLTLNEGVRGSL